MSTTAETRSALVEDLIGRFPHIPREAVLKEDLLRSGMAPTHIFLSACFFALVAAVATGLLAFRGNRAELFTAQEAAE